MADELMDDLAGEKADDPRAMGALALSVFSSQLSMAFPSLNYQMFMTYIQYAEHEIGADIALHRCSMTRKTNGKVLWRRNHAP
ncbi:MAG: hypothetical protein ACYC22_05950 [Thiomonas delicata]|jgi:hypothetical protein